MKHAVSISLGSSKRNKSVEVELLGEKVLIERIGTDGDMETALVAAASRDRALSHNKLNQLLDQLGFEPQMQELN